MKKLLQDRKTLYLVLGIVMISVFTLSIAYAAMSAVLEIHGNSEVVASSWDIHLDNVKVKTGSVPANSPQISGTSSVGFDVELNIPGDYYEFTVDVVNEGTIDAMIDSVVKTPELTSEQVKYIKYEITYENGESINTKQTLKKGTSTPIKVRVEYRKDLVASDLPSSVNELSLKLTLVYVQSDGSGSSIPNNGVKVVNVLSGDGTQVGNEVCIKEECFNVISSTDSTITMIAKYNLYVGGWYDGITWTPYGAEATGLQDSSMRGFVKGVNIRNGPIHFSSTNYWVNDMNEYPLYIYNENSDVYEYLENYKNYFMNFDMFDVEVRLISYEELLSLGCNLERCNKYSWLRYTSFWTGTALDDNYIYIVTSSGLMHNDYSYSAYFGVRPVITISRDYL